MNIWQAIILGIIQGLTEFLPISSSGHLILGQSWLGIDDMLAMKSFDIAVHVGTLLAIFVYFRADFSALLRVTGRFAKLQWAKASHRAAPPSTFTPAEAELWRFMGILIIGTIPAVLLGLLGGDMIDQLLLNPMSVTVMLAVGALVFLLAEYVHKHYHRIKEIGWREGIVIGLAQAVALVPGVSRSGATISAGLFLGVDRAKAARFSFILGSVAMMAATAYAAIKVGTGVYTLPPTDIMLIGIISSFLSGWLAISFLINFLKNHTLAVFAWYRLLLVAVVWGFWWLT